jgi:chemotaxis protein CheC
MSQFNKFAAFQFDVLKEVSNIGAGNAATALSLLLNKRIEMNVPSVNIIPFNDIAELFGGSENVVLTIFLRVEGEVPGNLFFILGEQQAKRLVQYVVAIDGSMNALTEMELSALNEIGNILAGSYLSALADLTSLHLSPTVPSLTIDMVAAILNFGLIQLGEMGDLALVIDTIFLEEQHEVEGHFFFIPDPNSFDKLFHALGVPLE